MVEKDLIALLPKPNVLHLVNVGCIPLRHKASLVLEIRGGGAGADEHLPGCADRQIHCGLVRLHIPQLDTLLRIVHC